MVAEVRTGHKNDLDLSTMTNSKEILPQYRDQLEAEITDIFLWAIGQNAITEMTETVREREPSSLPLHKLYSLFRLHFTPERNVHHSRADFFELKREGESAADVRKRIPAIEKNCEFEIITAAELLASKFLSVIGKSTGDYDLKKNIRKSDMSVEAITEALHEHMYEKLNDSPETEKKKNRYLNKRKAKSHKEQTDKPTKFKKMDCNRCGAPNWSRQHECPATGKKSAKCKTVSHLAKCCKINKKVNRIQEHETSSAKGDPSPNTIHWINQKIHSTCQMSKDGSDLFTLTALVKNRPIKFILDNRSPVTLIPKSLFNRITPLKPLKTEYRDVNNNRINFEGKTIAIVEIGGKRNDLDILVTTKKTKPLLGLDWIEKLGKTLDTGKTGPQVNHIIEDPDITTLKRKFKKLFHENHTVEGLEVKIQLKKDARLIQQKRRPIPIRLQQSVEKEITKLMKQGHIETTNNIDENCFVSPAVIIVKKDKLVKIAVDSRKLNEITIKRKAQMPNIEELISRISRKIADGPADEIWFSKFDLDYAYGQLILSREARNLCIFAVTGGNFSGYYRFLKGFYGLADIPTIIQGKIDQTLENKHPAWLDDMIVVTKGSKEQHKKDLIDVLTGMENARYKLSENKSEIFKTEIEWIGHKTDQNGIRSLQDKLMAIKELKNPTTKKSSNLSWELFNTYTNASTIYQRKRIA